MTTLIFVSPDGSAQTVDAPAGTTVMLAAITNGVSGIVADCNGFALCATCHVFVADPRLPPMSDEEDALLDGTAVPREADSRLACQIKLSDDLGSLTVRLPERQV